MAQPMLNLSGDLSPEQQIQQQQIARQQRMAELLMQQGQQTPQGQMVSGRYVAPNFFQYAAPLVQSYLGRKELGKVEDRQLDMAKRLREQGVQETQRLMNLIGGRNATPEQVTEMAGPYTDNVPMPTAYMAAQPAIEVNPRLALAEALNMQSPQARALLPQIAAEAFKKPEAFTLPEGSIRFQTMPDGTVRQVATGGEKPRAPVSVGNYLIDPVTGKVIFQAPEKPAAGQVVETANGPMIVNTRTGDAQPIMASGKPLEPKLTSEQSKDITAINQQRATINGAIDAVEKNKSAFGFVRGIAQNAPYGESLAGRFEKPEDTQARAYVFNNVSAVIKERAGTAQSAQELTRINSFLPSTTDNADQVISKLKGFNQYLDDLEKGTRVSPSKKPEAPQSNSFSSEADAQKAFSTGKLKAGDKITINGVTGTWK